MITINEGGSIIGDSAQATRGREGERERERNKQTDRQTKKRDRDMHKIKVTGKIAIELRFQNAINIIVDFMQNTPAYQPDYSGFLF